MIIAQWDRANLSPPVIFCTNFCYSKGFYKPSFTKLGPKGVLSWCPVPEMPILEIVPTVQVIGDFPSLIFYSDWELSIRDNGAQGTSHTLHPAPPSIPFSIFLIAVLADSLVVMHVVVHVVGSRGVVVVVMDRAGCISGDGHRGLEISLLLLSILRIGL